MSTHTKSSASLLFLIPVLTLWSLVAGGQTINVMTLNIRYDEPRDLEDCWPNRREKMMQMVSQYAPAFLGIQEGLYRQVAFMDSSQAKYSYIGVGRDDGAMGGEYCALFYDSTQFTCVRNGTFWLSETPDLVSAGWDAAIVRICTYGLFMHKVTRTQLWVFNTHFDHVGKVARRNSALLILEKIRTLTNGSQIPVVLMGDFNATPEDEPVKIIMGRLQDAGSISETPLSGPTGTFNGFKYGGIVDRRLDYVFVKGLDITQYMHIDDRTDANRWISDHLPVMATIRMAVK